MSENLDICKLFDMFWGSLSPLLPMDVRPFAFSVFVGGATAARIVVDRKGLNGLRGEIESITTAMTEEAERRMHRESAGAIEDDPVHDSEYLDRHPEIREEMEKEGGKP